MKKTFSLMLAVLCAITLSFSSSLTAFAAAGDAPGNGTDLKKYEIKTSSQHGTITPTCSVAVGNDKKITYSPDKGYQLKTLTVDSKAQDISKHPASYTFEKVSANHSIAAVFELAPTLKWERSVSRDDKDKTIAKYTVKLSQTVDGAEARDVVVEEKLPSDVTLNQNSLKGDGVTVAEKGDHQYKVTVGSLKNSVTYTYTATVPKDKDLKDVKGTMTMTASNFKKTAASSDSTPSGSDNESQTPGTSDNQQGQTPGTNDGQNQGSNDDQGTTPGGNEQGTTPSDSTSSVIPSITKTVSNTTPSTGDTVTYTIAVTMPQGVTSMKNVTVSDLIPKGIDIDSKSIKIVGSTGKVLATSSTDTTKQNDDSQIHVTFDELTANTTITFNAKVTATSGEVTNVATVSGTNVVKTQANATFTVKEGTPSPTETFTVTFIDGQGNILKTETVESGKNATAPADPKRDGYIFDGWDTNYTNVTSNLTVNAKWKAEQKKFSLNDTVYVAKNDSHWHYDKDCKNLSGKGKVSSMTLAEAKKTKDSNNKLLTECPDCAKGSTAATGGVYKEEISVTKPELKKTSDKKETNVSGIVKYTITASVKNDKVSGVTIKDAIPNGMELVKDSIKASDKGSITITNNMFNVTYKNIEKKTVTITYEAKAVKEGDQKNVATMTYTGSDSKSGTVTAENTVKVSNASGDSASANGKADGTVGRANYKTGDFLPYILGGVLIALLVAAYVVYRRRNKDGIDE